MVKEWIDGATLRDMVLAGAAQLENNKAYVDSLNVFPVPDGDTGSNMSMTMQGAAREVQSLPETCTADKVFLAASRGALRNARGNSGVILSQIFRGFAKASKGLESMDAQTLAKALQEGTDAAYKAVMKPKEGTILTVSRLIGVAAVKAVEQKPEISCLDLFSVVMKEGDAALKSTPDLLPVLKEAGVVDSGGQGLMFIYSGFYAALTGENISNFNNGLPKEDSNSTNDAELDVLLPENIEFGYCTEFFIVHLIEGFDEKDLDTFRLHLLRVGDSVVLVSDGDTVKVHVHSNCPGKILQMAMHYGELDRLKIENMREQNRQLLEARKRNRTQYAMVAVSTGEGIDSIFKDLNVKQIIAGGQTMNPSIDTIANAVKRANADTVFVLPNNSNIILAATQAAELCEDCNVRVIPSKTIPQGIYAAMAFNSDFPADENYECMLGAASDVISGSITFAVRETSINGLEIHEGDMIGLLNGDISVVESSIAEAAKGLVKVMLEKSGDEEASVTLYYGNDYSKEDAEMLSSELEELFPDADFNVQFGGQPLYYLYISVM